MTNPIFQGRAWRGRAWFLPTMVCLFIVALVMWGFGMREWAPVLLVGSLIPVGLFFYWLQKRARLINQTEREKILAALGGEWHIELLDQIPESKSESNTSETQTTFTGPFVNKEKICREICLKRRVCAKGSLILDKLGSIVKVDDWNENHLKTVRKGTIHIKWDKEEGKLEMQLKALDKVDEKEQKDESTHGSNSKKKKNGSNSKKKKNANDWMKNGVVLIKLKQDLGDPEVLMIKLSDRKNIVSQKQNKAH